MAMIFLDGCDFNDWRAAATPWVCRLHLEIFLVGHQVGYSWYSDILWRDILRRDIFGENILGRNILGRYIFVYQMRYSQSKLSLSNGHHHQISHFWEAHLLKCLMEPIIWVAQNLYSLKKLSDTKIKLSSVKPRDLKFPAPWTQKVIEIPNIDAWILNWPYQIW